MGLRALLGLSLIFAVCSAHPASDADLHPLEAGSPLSGRLGAVGVVVAKDQDAQMRVGTGFLITPCHVITAAHVLSRENTQVSPGLEVYFTPASGERAEALPGHTVAGTVIATSESFIPRPGGRQIDLPNVARDWALIELRRPVPNIEPFKLAYPGATLSQEQPLFALGYASNPHVGELYVDEKCPLWHGHPGAAPGEGILVANCAVRPGMSGGPLLFDAAGQLVVAGVLVERMEVRDQVYTMAVQVRSFAQRIAPLLRESHVCAAGMPFAAPPVPSDKQD